MIIKKPKKTEIKKEIVITEDRAIVLSFDTEFLGFTICDPKRLKKIINFEHLLLSKETAKEISYAIKNKEKISYYSCMCFSEILRIIYDQKEEKFYFDIFDNYFLKCKKGVLSDCEVSLETAEKISRYFQIWSLGKY